ncbi:MAG: type I-C CRISPR-associated endonuclease Cas1c [Bacteroidaceae bacterium]
MRKLLNTLYVTTANAYLSRDGMNVVVKSEDCEIFRISILNIEGIVSFGYMGASPALIQLCCEYNVALSFLNQNGRFMGSISGRTKGNVLLRRKQYRLADDHKNSLQLASIMIAGKIANSRNVIERYIRDHVKDSQRNELENVSQKLKRYKSSVLRAETFDELRGMEGDASCLYFSVFDHLIVSQKNVFQFHGRNRRPPKDKVNAMLSFVYTLLAHEVESALESVGLDPYVGFLHTDRPGRISLALDMMEELRSYIADRLVLTLINRHQIDEKGFVEHAGQGVVMDDKTRKELLQSWQKRKREEINHPYLGEKIPIGLIPYVQALLLARFLRGDIDNYPVFIVP